MLTHTSYHIILFLKGSSEDI